jgi:hypothetical protein
LLILLSFRYIMSGRNREPSTTLPSGSASDRSSIFSSPEVGNIFYNTDTSNVEIYHEDPSNNAAWRDLVVNNRIGNDVSLNEVNASGTINAYNIGVGGEIPEFIGDMKCIRAVADQYKGTSTSLEVVNSDSSAYSLYRANMTNTAQSHHWETYGTPNPVEKLTLTNSGRLGIGRSNPTYDLDVNGDCYIDNRFLFNANGPWANTDIFTGNSSLTRWYIKPEGYDSGTYKPLYVYLRGQLHLTGRLGIGTSDPLAPIDVPSGVSGNINVHPTNRGRFLTWNGIHTMSANQTVSVAGNFDGGSLVAHAIYCGYSIVLQSDERIKKDIIEIDDTEALETFRKLKPSKFKYKETLLSGHPVGECYGYIAQQVKEVLPEAVITGSSQGSNQGHMPNIMCLCSVKKDGENAIITIENEVDINTKTDNAYLMCDTKKTINDFEKGTDGKYHALIFYDKDNKSYERNVKEVIDDYTFVVDEIEGTLMLENKLFLYGQKPNDFQRLDKDVIFTITAGALQQIDKNQQEDRKRIDELNERIKKLEEQQAEIEELKARISALEN